MIHHEKRCSFLWSIPTTLILSLFNVAHPCLSPRVHNGSGPEVAHDTVDVTSRVCPAASLPLRCIMAAAFGCCGNWSRTEVTEVDESSLPLHLCERVIAAKIPHDSRQPSYATVRCRVTLTRRDPHAAWEQRTCEPRTDHLRRSTMTRARRWEKLPTGPRRQRVSDSVPS